MKDVFVSVVMCTYNGENFLSEQIKTILEQTHQNIELVIVDDCSADQTQAIIKEWMNKDQRIRFYQNETNIGYNKNFEKAITLARGDYIAISDQDDIWLPQKLERLLTAFDLPGVVLANAPSAKLVEETVHFKSSSLLYPFSGNDTRKLFLFNQITGHCILFKKELVAKIIPVPDAMFYDWWIGVVATCNGRIHSLQECLVYHRIHQTNSYFNKKRIKTDADILHAWKLFATIKEMKNEYKAFLLRLIYLVDRRRKKKPLFDIAMFFFLLKHSRLIFGHKKRKIPQITYLKYAILYSAKKL